MSILRLLALTSATAVAFAAMSVAPFVGFFLAACLPFAFALAYTKKPRSVSAYAILLLCVVPIYIASTGPAVALAYLIHSKSPSKPMWPYSAVSHCFPLSSHLDDSTTVGKMMIEYSDQWGEAAGCTRYASVFDGQDLGPWFWWVQQSTPND